MKLKVYDYMCNDGHWFESRHVYPPPRSLVCHCGQVAKRMASRFFTENSYGGVMGKAPIDDPDEIWGGTALEGTDGVNRWAYSSDKIQMDLGAGGKPPETKTPQERLRERLG